VTNLIQLYCTCTSAWSCWSHRWAILTWSWSWYRYLV